MAGISLGAFASLSTSSRGALRRIPSLFPGASRTRRAHGLFVLGNQQVAVHSSRCEGECLGVMLSLGSGSTALTSSMAPMQARAIARALHAAAIAAEGAQHRAGRVGQVDVTAGGAA